MSRSRTACLIVTARELPHTKGRASGRSRCMAVREDRAISMVCSGRQRPAGIPAPVVAPPSSTLRHIQKKVRRVRGITYNLRFGFPPIPQATMAEGVNYFTPADTRRRQSDVQEFPTSNTR